MRRKNCAMNLKIQKLRQYVSEKGRIAVALSGGLDSSALLAFCADALGAENCLALTANSPYMMREEIERSKCLADKLGVRRAEIALGIPEEILNNPPERCYLCKRGIFSKFVEEARKCGFECLADGANADDLQDHRPGMRAVKELGVISPFLECGLGKADIREIARSFSLENADSPAYACLLTRLEHGSKVDAETLRRIDAAEEFLRGMGLACVRVRKHGNIARIEIPPEDFEKFLAKRDAALSALKELGFARATLDLDGYTQGSMNAK